MVSRKTMVGRCCRWLGTGGVCFCNHNVIVHHAVEMYCSASGVGGRLLALVLVLV